MWRSNYTAFCKIDLSFFLFCLFKTFKVYQRAKVKLPVTSSSLSGKVSMLKTVLVAIVRIYSSSAQALP